MSLEEDGMEICEGGKNSVDPRVVAVVGLAVDAIVDDVVTLGFFTTRYR
jgi:preprotein translocase subunit Sec61beta